MRSLSVMMAASMLLVSACKADVTPTAKPVVAAAPAVVSATVAPTAAAPVAQTKASVLTVTADDRVEGGMMAPITVFEYASLSCSHCADFNKETYPQIKKEWIDSGKAKFVFRDMPWDDMAVGMAKVARCAPAAQFRPLVDTFFAQQMKIMTAKAPLNEIKSVAAMAGMSGEQVDACIKDADLHAKVTGSKDTAFNVLEVRGTPTFFVNGTAVNGAVPYKDFKKTLDAEYAKATGKK